MANTPRYNQARPVQKIKQSNAAEEDRQQRLNKSLRENLLKRKKQSRIRQQQQVKTKSSSAAQTKGMQD